MDIEAIVAAVETAAELVGPAARQFGQLLAAFTTALPAIEQGIASAEPFIAAGLGLIRSGGAPDAALWQAQLEALAGGSNTLAGVAAADAAGN